MEARGRLIQPEPFHYNPKSGHVMYLRNQPPGAGGTLKHEVPDSNNLTHLNY